MVKRKDKLGRRPPRGGAGNPPEAGSHRDGAHRGPQRSRRAGAQAGGRTGGKGAPAALWLFGVHPVLAALANPNRRPQRLLVTAEASQTWGPRLRELCQQAHPGLLPQTVQRREIDALLPEGSVHQGLALFTPALDQPALEDLLKPAENLGSEAPDQPPRRVIVLLDQVTDPHNVGAILRSAAAFGALAVVALDKGAPEESGTLAKSASGALEAVPYISVINLARSLDALKAAGFWCLGLAGEAAQSLADANPGSAVALVLGAEGPGLRRLTRERCDLLVKLPTRPPIDSLNVSNAAAVALYELLGRPLTRT